MTKFAAPLGKRDRKSERISPIWVDGYHPFSVTWPCHFLACTIFCCFYHESPSCSFQGSILISVLYDLGNYSIAFSSSNYRYKLNQSRFLCVDIYMLVN